MSIWAITGATGFIGTALQERVRSIGAESRTLSGDICDRERLRQLVSEASVVVHLAAWVHKPARSKQEVAECWRVNRDGTIALLDAVEAVSPNAFIVFASTGSVYAPSREPLTETSPVAPRTPYGESKLAAENALLERIKSRRLQGVILRPALVVGPEAPGNLTRLASMIRRRLLPTIGMGGQRKTIVPVSMLVDAIIGAAAAREVCNGQVFNVGGEPLTILEIGHCIAQALAVRPIRIPLPYWPLPQIARLADALAGTSLQQTLETYSRDFLLDGDKLRGVVPMKPVDPKEAVAASVRRHP